MAHLNTQKEIERCKVSKPDGDTKRKEWLPHSLLCVSFTAKLHSLQLEVTVRKIEGCTGGANINQILPTPKR